MKISELIAKLEEIKQAEGDIEVHAYGYGDITDFPVGPPEIIDPATWPKPKRLPKYVLVE
jgi:hypothetical protein